MQHGIIPSLLSFFAFLDYFILFETLPPHWKRWSESLPNIEISYIFIIQMTQFRTATSIIVRKPRVYTATEGECLLVGTIAGIMTTWTYVWTRRLMRRVLIIFTWMLHNQNLVNFKFLHSAREQHGWHTNL